jgi:hypothetical protein
VPLEAFVALGQCNAGELECCGAFTALAVIIALWGTTTAPDRKRKREARRLLALDAKARAAAEATKAEELAQSKTRRCPNTDCLHENKPGAKHCCQCGHPLDDPPIA